VPSSRAVLTRHRREPRFYVPNLHAFSALASTLHYGRHMETGDPLALFLPRFSERPDGGSHHGGSRDRAPLSLGPRSPFRPCVAAICWIRSAKSSIALGDEE